MGSDLYTSVEYQVDDDEWLPITEYQTAALARGPIVDHFGGRGDGMPKADAAGYLTHDEWKKMQEHEECPWRLDEPYWVRLVPGSEFVQTVREEPWRAEWPDDDAGPHLRAVAAMVESYIKDGVSVRVWCWHSQ